MDTTGGQQVPPIPQRIIGPYQLLAQLGQTPTGPVYLARLHHKETLFALKLLPPVAPDELQRMRHEISLLARVDHPSVVRPVDMGSDRGRTFVVTEHVPGTTLREQLDRRGPLPPRQAARVAAEVATRCRRSTTPACSTGTSTPAWSWSTGATGAPRSPSWP